MVVTKEDQMRINAFSRMNNRKHELQDEIKELDSDILRITDAESEVLADEIRLAIGDSFCLADMDEAEAFLSRRKERAEDRKVSLQAELELVADKMGTLKTLLYSKFGKSINLEE